MSHGREVVIMFGWISLIYDPKKKNKKRWQAEGFDSDARARVTGGSNFDYLIGTKKKKKSKQVDMCSRTWGSVAHFFTRGLAYELHF